MPCYAFDGENMNGEVCSCDWLRRQLEDDINLLLLDCRVQNEDNVSHISGALQVTIPTLMLRRLKKGTLSVASVIKSDDDKKRFATQCNTDTVVVYDESTADVAENPTSVVCLLVKKLQEDGCRVRLLKGGFCRFQETCPDFCVRNEDRSASDESVCIFGLRQLQLSADDPPPRVGGGGDTDPVSASSSSSSSASSSSPTAPFPVEVMRNLFLGNAKVAADRECLHKHNICFIVNVTPDIANEFTHDARFRYLRIPINDHWSQNLSSFFPQAIAFIDEARDQQCGVLVHCLAGISRSVTVTVAYLMHHLSLSLNDAYDYVKRCKSNISPNFNFMGQLLDFESALVAGRQCSCEKSGLSPCTVCATATKTYFTSPATCKVVSAELSLSASSASSTSSSSSSTSSSSSEFQYDIPPTPS